MSETREDKHRIEALRSGQEEIIRDLSECNCNGMKRAAARYQTSRKELEWKNLRE